MLQTNSTTYPMSPPRRAFEPPAAGDVRTDEPLDVRRERQQELAMDDALAASFPASDPPAWNPGVAYPSPDRRDDFAVK